MGGNGLGIYDVEGIIHHCSVDEAGALASNTYDAIIASSADRGSRVEDNRVEGSGCRYSYNIAGNISVGGNRVFSSASTRDYNFATSSIQSRAYSVPFHYQGTLETYIGSSRLPIVAPGRIIAVRISVDTAPTGASIIVDVNLNGTTIFPTTTKPTIAAAANMNGQSIPDDIWVAAGDYLTIDIDQVGSTEPGADLVVNVLIENDLEPAGT